MLKLKFNFDSNMTPENEQELLKISPIENRFIQTFKSSIMKLKYLGLKKYR